MEGREHRVMEPLKGTTMETLGSEIVCTKLEWIAMRAERIEEICSAAGCVRLHAANP